MTTTAAPPPRLPDGLPTPTWKDDRYAVALYRADCLDVLAAMPDGCVGACVTDPPYFKVKDDAWDRQWSKPVEFLTWLDTVLAEFARIMAQNASLYCFASPQMSARVECLIADRFHVLNRITWRKEAGRHRQACKEDLRAFFPASESIVFAEHYGADNMAKGEAGWGAKCDELRGFVFEPLRAYLAGEWARAGLKSCHVEEATGHQMASHYMTRSQWALPTRENYEKLRNFANARESGDYLRREYEDLRREYEDLHREYEDLRRPFNVTADVPYTDVWAFPTVQAYKGKHPCEKPLALMEHIITASTPPGGVVLDPFAGSATTGVACVNLGRAFIGVELEPKYFDIAVQRISQAIVDKQDGPLFATHEPAQMEIGGDTPCHSV